MCYSFRELTSIGTKLLKNIGKKVVTIAKNNPYKRLYQELDTKEGGKEVLKLAMVTERRPRDLANVMCIKTKTVGSQLRKQK